MKFWTNLETSQDPYDNLGELAQYLNESVKSTGCYIGQLEFPFVAIGDDADAEAHLDRAKPEVIKYDWANEDHKPLIVGTELPPTKGITHDVFAQDFTDANEDLAESFEEGSLLEDFKHIYRAEVVRESRMNYWKVPRLGAYMAVPLVYRSALSVSSLQQAFDELTKFNEETTRIENEKAAFEEQQAVAKADAEAAGTEFVPEAREWPEVTLPPIVTELRKFVVCIDLMGQDREFTEEQKTKILETVFKFKDHWEKFEKKCLEEDRDALIKERAIDAVDLNEEVVLGIREKEDTLVDKTLNPQTEESESKKEEEKVEEKGKKKTAKEKKEEKEKAEKAAAAAAAAEAEKEEPEQTVEQKQEITSDVRLKFQTDLLKDDKLVKERFEGLAQRKVVKFEKLIQAIFYLLGFEISDICETHRGKTQKLFWKGTKKLWMEKLIPAMEKFQYKGPKSGDVKTYQRLSFVEYLISEYTFESCAQYNFALAIIHRWIKLAIEARRRDIAMRTYQTKLKKEEREAKQEEEKQRQEDRKKACEDAESAYQVENKKAIERYADFKEAQENGTEFELEEGEEEPEEPIFDDKYFLYHYDEEHPEIPIPDEVMDDIDNDWIIEPEKREEVINDYLNQQSEAAAHFGVTIASARK